MSDDPTTEANCDFCAIAQGEDDAAEIICTGAQWIAFFPLHPATPGHTLVIPTSHVSDLWQAEPSLVLAIMSGVTRTGRAIDEALHPDGMNLITSAGSTAEQSVFHLHLHVVPRWRADNFGEIWPPERTYDDYTLDNVADRIREQCERDS